MWWDSSRNVVVIEKSGLFRAYQIGAGKSPAFIQHKKKSEVLKAIAKRPASGISPKPTKTPTVLKSNGLLGIAPIPLLIVEKVQNSKANKKTIEAQTSFEGASTKALSAESALDQLNNPSLHFGLCQVPRYARPQVSSREVQAQTWRQLRAILVVFGCGLSYSWLGIHFRHIWS